MNFRSELRSKSRAADEVCNSNHNPLSTITMSFFMRRHSPTRQTLYTVPPLQEGVWQRMHWKMHTVNWRQLLRICWRKTSDIYGVLRREYAATNSFVSRFLIPREVSVCCHRRLHCTCKFFERHGFPSRHICTITNRVDATDFDIRWWLKYGQMYGEPGIAIVVTSFTLVRVSCFVAY